LQNSAEPTGHDLDTKATREHEEEMGKVVECLQGVHGFESKEDCLWALFPDSDVNGFMSGRICQWAIAKLGATSDVREVEKKRLKAVLFEEKKYSGRVAL